LRTGHVLEALDPDHPAILADAEVEKLAKKMANRISIFDQAAEGLQFG
jgi:hypothetical protein